MLAAQPSVDVPRILLIPVIVGEAKSSTEQIHQAVSARLKEARFWVHLNPYSEVLTQDQGAGAKTVRACGSDAMCIARMLPAQELDLLLVAVVNRTLGKPLISVVAVEPRRMEIVARAVDTMAREVESFSVAQLAEQLLTKLRFSREGKVSVKVSPAAASLETSAELRPIVAEPGVFIGPQGAAWITAAHEGYFPKKVQVSIAPLRRTEVELKLERKPRSIFYSPVFWAVAGAVVVGGAAVGTWAALNRQDDSRLRLVAPMELP